MKNPCRRWICLLLIAVLALQLTACVPQARAADLMEGIEPSKPGTAPELPEAERNAAADFALRLFRAGNGTGSSRLLSPFSVLCALAMTANGAKGETLEQMERALGMTKEELNACFLACREALAGSDQLRLANSVWFKDEGSFAPNRDFLQTNADIYGAELYGAPFDDDTLAEINGWVREKTDGMIPRILEAIPGNVVMYLINALAFDAKWEEIYKQSDVQPAPFTRADGTRQIVDFLYGEESQYLETESATGFLKPYEGGRYAFLALLPKEGLSPEDCLAALDGETLTELIRNPQWETVFTALPKFETACEAELSDALKTLGMELPFDADRADFSGIGSSPAGNIYISRVLHKTFLAVDEAGVRAGAATVVEMPAKSAEPEEVKQVYLDRPFVYMLIDTETCLPLFLGTMTDPSA